MVEPVKAATPESQKKYSGFERDYINWPFVKAFDKFESNEQAATFI